MDSPADHAINVAITTHTTRHLRRTILGASALKPAAARIVIACDNDRADVRELVLASSQEFAAGLPQGLIYVSRPSVGECALSQNRNNAIRALIARGARESESVAFLDGDCIPARDLLAVHASALKNPASRRDLVCAYRVDLSAEQTECIDESAILAGHPAARITAEQSALLTDRQRRHARAARLRGLGLGVVVKGHKPKILGANFAVTLRAYLAVNGFDEEYLGYGSEDDDFARRIYAASFRPAVRVDSAIVCHQWHETRKPANWHDSPGVKRFELSLPTRCVRGVENPMPQQQPVIEVFINGQAKPVSPGAIS
jgi:N-acetylglucosaminyl-diphospho-decaprenol L-rhamnosyltransferase